MDERETLELARARTMCRSGEAERIRTEAGLSLAELASPLGVSAVTVFRWERCERAPRGEAAVQYGRLLAKLKRAAAR